MTDHTILLPDLAATDRFAARLAAELRPGDCVALSGGLGAGKTTLARAIICALAGREVEVPSPTYTLMQSYDTPRGTVWHLDLYRLKSADELSELGLEDVLAEGIALIEWPEVAEGALPERTRRLELEVSSVHNLRTVTWQALSRPAAREALLAGSGWGASAQTKLQGDASSRRYTRLRRESGSAMLMDAPPQDVDVRDYVSIARHLHACGYSAPEVYAVAEEWGLVLSEDLGDDLFTPLLARGAADEEALYDAAVDVLAAWHNDARMQKAHSALALPDYDRAALLREAALFSDWFLPETGGAAGGKEYLALWERLLDAHSPECRLFVHRDYHADNLLWLPERQGIARVGLLDFQDALWGHGAYDLVSLLEDARRDVPEAVTERSLRRYLAATGQDAARFMEAYALLGAQRNCKIVGIFLRLSRRDGKHGYLKHLPRVWRHLERDLRHPALAPLKAWMDAHVPPAFRGEIAAHG